MSGDVALLVVSTDSYADLWRPFFALFRRYWPDCPYPVYLGSNFRTYADDGVRTLTVGEDVDWSSGLAAMLRRLEEPFVLVMLEDYLLSARVDTARIDRLHGYMVTRAAACLRLIAVPGAPRPAADFPEAGELPRGMPYRVSLQAATWERATLLDLLRPGESPWQLEGAGTRRSNERDAPFLSVVAGRPGPLPYFVTGVRRGRWQRDAVRFCRREGIEPDLAARPQESRPMFLRRKAKWYRQMLREWLS